MKLEQKNDLLQQLDIIKQNGINIRARYNRLSCDQIVKAADRAIELVGQDEAPTKAPLIKK